MAKIKVMVGLSGGVDSAVAAYLLKEQGYEVIGGFMRNWDSLANNDFLGNPNLKEDTCPQEADYDDAVAVAQKLDIPLVRQDFINEYWDYVFSYFLDEYKAGRTPNPDIFCNKYIKFAAFLKFAHEQGCQYIATGHYAKVLIDEKGVFRLAQSLDENKDQTYFLSQLNQEQLKASLFPLANLKKQEVRTIAAKLGLEVADKKDSTGVCFIGERHFKQFLTNYIPAQPGEIIDIVSGEVLGKHSGVFYYTIGQRKGLGIGGISGHEATSWIVVKKDVVKNILYVTSKLEKVQLAGNRVIIDTLNWNSYPPTEDKNYQAKFRYRQQSVEVVIEKMTENQLIVTLPTPLEAITPGQGAVLYDGQFCLGGGIISQVYYDNLFLN